ncbi:hypothetical protein LNAOJCKE_4554 [Methylorubrum aminovorans]|uniref:Tail terminator n=1 Tax=Methylorubrum aminovorans TaxID=269069 RepID=A0ABQ4UJY1_9HYPH|nr:hypothetical protein [Methylorubrum aminovorans]GJE67323.1 hypothetical protein LNAOJCKE_4554 [Methylorubrum aminovorans]GMA74376.1 hypothetical protein GCM10025880_07930 [Methylorubrum aminovorans]
MPSKREQVIEAVAALVKAALPKATHYRNEVKQRAIEANGYVNVDDGDPGEPEVTLNPTTWIYEHELPVEVAANAYGTKTAEARLDAMLQAIGTAVAADRTLGGLCDYLQVSAAATEPLTAEGAKVSRLAVVGITAVYGTTDPLN